MVRRISFFEIHIFSSLNLWIWWQSTKCNYCDFISTFFLPQYLLPDQFTKLSTKVGTFIQSSWSFQFSYCSVNLTISNPIKTSNCNLETVKNEGILTSAIFFSLLADWESETVGTQNTYCYLQTLEIKQIYIPGIFKGKLQSVEQLL